MSRDKTIESWPHAFSPVNLFPTPWQLWNFKSQAKERFPEYFAEWRRSSKRQRIECTKAVVRLMVLRSKMQDERGGGTSKVSSEKSSRKILGSSVPPCVAAQTTREEAMRLFNLWRAMLGWRGVATILSKYGGIFRLISESRIGKQNRNIMSKWLVYAKRVRVLRGAWRKVMMGTAVRGMWKTWNCIVDVAKMENRATEVLQTGKRGPLTRTRMAHISDSLVLNILTRITNKVNSVLAADFPCFAFAVMVRRT